jgi:uncharacterized membrane protein
MDAARRQDPALFRFARWIRSYISLPGIAVGAVCFALSLTPSLIPRSFLIQGVLSGCVFAVGYAIGAAFEWLWYFMQLPPPRGRLRLWLTGIVSVLCVILVVYCLSRAAEWQNSVRLAMGAEPVETGHPIQVLLVAIVPAVLLIIVGTLIERGIEAIARRLGRYVPPRVALVGSIAVVGVLAATLFSGVLLRGALRAADAFFEQLDDVASRFAEPPPARPDQSGSAQSLIAWSTIGRDGRNYVQTGPDKAAIEQRIGRPALDPIRVSVGMRSAPTVAARADLALAELKRVGAFDRAILLVISPVGTGWVDPAGMDALEYLMAGDVASVSLQYSYLLSPLSLVVEPDYGSESARALFDKVYGYWTTLPHDRRPRLYLNGLSLGAHASQDSTQILDVLSDPYQGALWAGPPFTSPVWRWATASRNPGSPAWRPAVGDGTTIRFSNQGNGLAEPAGRPWGPIRIGFLQYASDPIVFFDFDSLYREPDWMKGERGPDVSGALTWYPVVTFFQLGMDMALSLTSPLGHGHVYAPADYIDAWMALVEPQGWSPGQIARLKSEMTAEFEAGQ